MAKNRAGFTLIELLVVIAIIAILAATLFPMFLGAKQKAQGVQCLSNMRQLNMACRMYMDDNQDGFPMYAFYDIPNSLWWQVLKKYTKNERIVNCPGRKSRGFGMNHPTIGKLLWSGTRRTWRGAIWGPCVLNDIASPTRTVIFADTGYVINKSEPNPDGWIEDKSQGVDYFRTPANDNASNDYTNDPRRVINRHFGTASCAYVDGHCKPTKVTDIGFQYYKGHESCYNDTPNLSVPPDPRCLWDIY